LKVESYFTGGVDSATLSAWFEREVQMANQDRVIFETNEARNALESYIYEMRNKLSDELSSYSTDSERSQLSSLLDEAESWLYGDGAEANKSAYVKKLQELKQIGDSLQRRLYEAENRNSAVEQYKSTVAQYINWANSKDEKFSHIPEEERKKVVDEANKSDQWLVNNLIQLDRQPKTSDPIISIQQIHSKRAELEKFANPIVNKPKPAPPKVAENKPAEEPKSATSETTEKPVENPQANPGMDTTH